jgi:hypothetical protein
MISGPPLAQDADCIHTMSVPQDIPPSSTCFSTTDTDTDMESTPANSQAQPDQTGSNLETQSSTGGSTDPSPAEAISRAAPR